MGNLFKLAALVLASASTGVARPSTEVPTLRRGGTFLMGSIRECAPPTERQTCYTNGTHVQILGPGANEDKRYIFGPDGKTMNLIPTQALPQAISSDSPLGLIASLATLFSFVAITCCCVSLRVCRPARNSIERANDGEEMTDQTLGQSITEQQAPQALQALRILVNSPSPRSSSETPRDPNESAPPTSSPRNLNSNSSRVESTAGQSI